MHKKISAALLSLLILVLSCYVSLGQKESPPPGFEGLPKLTAIDSIGLVNLPELKLPESLKGKGALELPDIVDNSLQPYWRPVFAQVQYECGQASGVGLGFTYAINRLRDLPSNLPENQYPTHFTWNFGNGGNGWYGVSYFHSFEIIKREGCPTVIDFGSMTGTGPEMWMSGYDKYYNAMHNRVADVYKIDLTTEEGINTLKNWLHNHLEGSDVGGVANFYTSAPYGMPTLPSGTPEAGMFVVTSWGGANHGLTISGYHDSICWDYNNDGQYTNDIDLNGDNKITPQDWEIGGLRFANTYSGGPSFGNNGFSYMTYKSCADPYGGGGIWDNAAHVIYAKAGTEPLLTAKISLEYNCRDRIRVQMGMTTDLASETPEYVLGFPVFNFQGGCQYMQGGTTNEDHKTIEFGLDITPFLNMIEPGTPAKYFLMITEDDPEGWGYGLMLNYSIIDYTNGVEEIICDQANVTINPDDLTKVWVEHTVDYETAEITTDVLTPATVYEPYNEQLEAAGGAEPYTWGYDMNFTENASTAAFPAVSGEQLNPSNSNDGYALKTLDFSFPFYDYQSNQVRVNVDGYISFENMFSWPYQVYDFFHFTKNKLISPMQADLRLYSGVNDGIWYEGDENSATFRWKASVNGFENTSEVNFAVELFSNGDIKFYYGDINDYPAMEWISGISSGDNIFYQFTEVSNDPTIPANLMLNMEATHYPEEFSITRYGEFQGTAQQTYDNFEIKVQLIDENNLVDSKVLSFSTDGSNYLVIKNSSVLSGDDEVLEFGESATLSVEIENLGDETIYGADMQISCDDPFITLTDSTEQLGDFEPGEIKVFTDVFAVEVDNAVPDAHEVDIATLIMDDAGDDWSSHIYLMAYSPDVVVSSVSIDDGGNGGLDPGETADMIVTLHNDGGADVYNIESILSSNDPYITINSANFSLDMINAGATGNAVFNVSAAENTPAAYIVEFEVDLAADNEYSAVRYAYVVCGLLMEGFESGNFYTYPWTFSGDDEWTLDNSTVYQGEYSARSGNIGDEEETGMQLDMFVLSDGEISFFRKVSSEANYDYLRFYIDGELKADWEGEQDWEEVSFPVTAGLHAFLWQYEKDYSVSSGSDCAWVDNILLPPFGDIDPQLLYTPENFLVVVEDNIVAYDTLNIYNAGTGPLIYSLDVIDSLGNPVEWCTPESLTGGLNPGGASSVPIAFDATNLEEGLYEADLVITDHIDNEYLVPVWFYVDLSVGIDEISAISGVRNIPNPFTSSTAIEFTLNRSCHVTIEIYTMQGRKIKTLLQNVPYDPGTFSAEWNTTGNGNESTENGIYYYRILAGDDTFNGKMILLK